MCHRPVRRLRRSRTLSTHNRYFNSVLFVSDNTREETIKHHYSLRNPRTEIRRNQTSYTLSRRLPVQIVRMSISRCRVGMKLAGGVMVSLWRGDRWIRTNRSRPSSSSRTGVGFFLILFVFRTHDIAPFPELNQSAPPPHLQIQCSPYESLHVWINNIFNFHTHIMHFSKNTWHEYTTTNGVYDIRNR